MLFVCSFKERRTKVSKRGVSKDSRGMIKERVDISQRPAFVDQKLRKGDLEIDPIIGKNHKGAILTINNRVSNFLWMAIMEKNLQKIKK
jgi:transposase, IS30 family